MAMDDPRDWHILCICLFPLINAIGIAASILLSTKGNRLLLSCGIIFSAGVLLSSSLVHMLPHSTEALAGFGESGDGHDHGSHEESELHAIEETLEVMTVEDEHDDHGHAHRFLEEGADHDHPFPWAYTFFGIAFLFLLCVEASVERFIDIKFAGKQGNFFHSHGDDAESGHDHGAKKDNAMDETEKVDASRTEHRERVHPDADDDNCVPCNIEKVQHMVALDEESEDLEAPDAKNKSSKIVTISESQSMYLQKKRGSSAWAKTAGRPSVASFVATDPTSFAESAQESESTEQKEQQQQQSINPWVSILLTLVLSIHVILEGLTIGSSQDVDTIKTTFIAVVIHKGFAAFALGSSLIASGYWGGAMPRGKTMFFVLSGIYISVDIVALGIGMGLGSAFDDSSSLTGILQALLGGSFLFVSTVELIPGELEKMRTFNLPLVPILAALCLGFGLMTLIGNWV